MLFTNGRDREYERMMQEKPGFGRRKQRDKNIQFATADNKDCPYCLYYDEKNKKCCMNSCIVFDE